MPTLYRLLKWIGLGSLALFLSGGVYLLLLLHNVPHLDSLVSYRPMLTSQVLDQDGKVIGEFFHENRDFIPFNQIPDWVIKAFIASEDQKFFQHSGLDFQGITRAFLANLKSGRIVQGGSTITQQVAKSLLLSSERTFTRKIKEAYLAFKIENKLSKDEILALYLNQIYLGQGAYGIKRAAWNYFRKEVNSLTLAEIALLAGLPQAPSRYSPLKSPKSAKARQHYVLTQLVTSHVITQLEADTANTQPLVVYPMPKAFEASSAHFVEYVRRTLGNLMPENALYEGGWRIQTSLNNSFQAEAHENLWRGLRAIDKRRGYRGPLRHMGTENPKKILAELKAKNFLSDPSTYTLQPNGRVEPQFPNAAGRPKQEEIYPCLVLNTTADTALVSNGVMQGPLPLKHMAWARPLNPQTHGALESVTDVRQVLKPGDIILAKIEQTQPLQFALEQEPLIDGALLSIHIPTGKILAMAGGKDFGQSQFNRTYQAMRQLGSTFKPIIYAKAIDLGLTPNTIILDAPIVYEEKRPNPEDATTVQNAKTLDQAAPEDKAEDNLFVWKPDNYGQAFLGDVTLREALIKSRNIPTIKLVQSIGIDPVIEFAQKLGVHTEFPKDLSLSLGSISTSLWDIMKPYAIFASGGKRIEFYAIEDMSSVNTGYALFNTPKPKLPKPQDPPEEVISPQLAFMMTHLLRDAVQSGTGITLNKLEKPFAGKTGTTNDFVDAWFIGYTPDILTGVWVGFDQPEYIGTGEAGARAAGPIWLAYMKKVVQTYPIQEFVAPPTIVYSWMDPKTGKVGDYKSGRVQVAFLEGTIPQKPLVIGGFGKLSPEEIQQAINQPTQESSTTSEGRPGEVSGSMTPMADTPPASEEKEELSDEEILFGQY